MLMPTPTGQVASRFNLLNNTGHKGETGIKLSGIANDGDDVIVPLYEIEGRGRTLDVARLQFQSKLEEDCAGVLLSAAIDNGYDSFVDQTFLELEIGGFNVALRPSWVNELGGDERAKLALIWTEYEELYGRDPLKKYDGLCDGVYRVRGVVGICAAKPKKDLHLV